MLWVNVGLFIPAQTQPDAFFLAADRRLVWRKSDAVISNRTRRSSSVLVVSSELSKQSYSCKTRGCVQETESSTFAQWNGSQIRIEKILLKNKGERGCDPQGRCRRRVFRSPDFTKLLYLKAAEEIKILISNCSCSGYLIYTRRSTLFFFSRPSPVTKQH